MHNRLNLSGKITILLGVFLLLTWSCQQPPPPNTSGANNTNGVSANKATPAPAADETSAAKKEKIKKRSDELAAKTRDNGCWVHIWEDENFQDDNDVIIGPGKWGSMRNLPGANKTDWGDEIDSLKVGPKATVTVWEDEDFKDNSRTFGPGSELNNLRGDPDLGDNVDSMEIKCQ